MNKKFIFTCKIGWIFFACVGTGYFAHFTDKGSLTDLIVTLILFTMSQICLIILDYSKPTNAVITLFDFDYRIILVILAALNCLPTYAILNECLHSSRIVAAGTAVPVSALWTLILYGVVGIIMVTIYIIPED